MSKYAILWTATAVASELRAHAADLWRIVEAQHVISTSRLAGSLADQARLEALIEDAKPPLPPEARGLDPLLATPFRYYHQSASRFRRKGARPGIFYASEAEATALSETSYWRLVFLSRSPGLPPPTTTQEWSAFTIATRLTAMLDLTRPPFAVDAVHWKDPDDYSACQALADQARTALADAIRYTSVRDPEHRANVAVLNPHACGARKPRIRTTWHLRFDADGLSAFAAFPSRHRYRFTRAEFGL